ncbi:MAG: alpha/beta fold hydrolase, partial [Flavobacteriaceae bacterium]|nr:alpha/beta fold hydrolase [Flavobacteriaceae bacterium]
MNAQHITYYNDNNEDFADVYIEDNLIFTCRVAGLENTGGTVILLHGWPETSKMWSKLLPFLSSKNYRVIAPDQRGYSKGARPLKVKDYSAHKLAQDIINIADSFGAKKFHLVGHDWGSGIGWYLSSFNKNRILSFSALAVPHLDA